MERERGGGRGESVVCGPQGESVCVSVRVRERETERETERERRDGRERRECGVWSSRRESVCVCV